MRLGWVKHNVWLLDTAIRYKCNEIAAKRKRNFPFSHCIPSTPFISQVNSIRSNSIQ